MKVYDFYDRTIKEGVRVAFNYQGAVRKGIVENVMAVTRNGRNTNWNGELYLNIYVKHDGTYDGATRVSKVSNRHNLIVL